MGVITILLAAGIGVFLFWFFEGIVKEIAKADDNETEYVILHRGNSASCQNQRCTARSSIYPGTVRLDLPVQDIDTR